MAADTLNLLGALALVLVGGRIGAALSRRLGQPEVLGELLIGVVLGNLGLAGFHALDPLASLPGLDLLAQFGVIFLLFMVGLESDFGRLMAVGPSALLVATLGVIAPIALGFVVSSLLEPAREPLVHWFVGAMLCATSVGLTARVLADLKRSDSSEGRIILGAAVVDDVLGLIVLAVVAGVIDARNHGAAFQPRAVFSVLAKAVGFLAGAILLGRPLAAFVFRRSARYEAGGLLLSLGLAFCFSLSWLAGRVGLAPIVGAFAAGLVLEERHTRALREREERGRGLSELIEPLAAFLVPVFFVAVGLRVDLSAFGAPGVAWFAIALTAVAVVSKQVCGLGVLARGTDRIAVGFGMIPRGEVGLIFASFGAAMTLGGERVVDAKTYGACVMMVALTTLVAPPLLAWRLKSLARRGK
jgi:Kef-type K+ transport system membrane component KefB